MDLFGTAGIRGSVEDRVTPELALAVGRAVAAEIRNAAEGDERRAADESGWGEESASERDDEPASEIVLARDGRVTGPAIAAAMAA
ncbi:phosphomannomutase, partial [Halorubrum sp. CBA1125]|nr:phosphomannomutase [Halorubrum sp. CBA1125]